MSAVTRIVQTPIVISSIKAFFNQPDSVLTDDQIKNIAANVVGSLDEVGEIKNVILSELLYEGDRVVMNMDKEARGWGRKGVPDGTIGTITGVHRYSDYSDRYNGPHGKEPGIYETDGVRYVEWDDFVLPEGEKLEDYNRAQASDVTMLDQVLQRRRYQNDWVNNPLDYDDKKAAMNHIVRIGDLPETKFYELDKVRIIGSNFRAVTGHIHRIQYHVESDDHGMVYDVQLDGGGSTWLRDDDLELIARGNVWKHYHNEALGFESLEDQVRFYIGMGWAKNIKNPSSGSNRWTKEEALVAIKNNEAHCLSLSFTMTPATTKVEAVYSVDDPVLAEDIRVATLRNFGLQPA